MVNTAKGMKGKIKVFLKIICSFNSMAVFYFLLREFH